MKIRNGNKLKTLINIYAPANPAQRIAFYDELFKILSKNKSDDCFLAGDFNITLQDKDILGLRGKQRQGRYELSQIIQLLANYPFNFERKNQFSVAILIFFDQSGSRIFELIFFTNLYY